MKFTTKSRYALNALIELHLMEIDGPVKVSKIAEMQSIEITYLEQLFRKLRIAGLIDSTRGRNGGYFFAKDPTKISVKDIMIAVEEDLDATSCSGCGALLGGVCPFIQGTGQCFFTTGAKFLERTAVCRIAPGCVSGVVSSHRSSGRSLGLVVA